MSDFYRRLGTPFLTCELVTYPVWRNAVDKSVRHLTHEAAGLKTLNNINLEREYYECVSAYEAGIEVLVSHPLGREWLMQRRRGEVEFDRAMAQYEHRFDCKALVPIYENQPEIGKPVRLSRKVRRRKVRR